MKVKGLCKSVADVDLSGREFDSLSLKIEVANAIKQNSDDIFLAVKDGERWRKMKSGMEIRGSDVEIAYLVVQRRIQSEWEFVRNVERKGLRVEKRSGAGSNAVTWPRGDIGGVLLILSTVERCRKYLIPVAEVLQVWSGDDGGFLVQFDAETDLHHFVTENRAIDIRVRYCINKVVEWHKIAWQRKFVRITPHFEINDREEVGDKILRGGVESVLTGIKEDVAGIIRSCVAPEEDRATFSSLLDSLSLDCSVTLTNSATGEDQRITGSAAFSWTGLRTERVVDIVAAQLRAEVGNVFVWQADKIVLEDVVTTLYQPHLALSFMIIASIDPFTQKKMIAKGGFGIVYVYEDREGNRFAMKEIHKAVFKSSELTSFLREIQVLKGLRHERIMECLGYYHSQRETLYVQMVLMETSLGALVRASVGGLTLEEVRSYTRKIVEGVVFLHDHAIMHRDLKCDNVLVKGDEVRLADFGLSKGLTQSIVKVPQQHSFVGTVYAMAPEMIAEEPYDASIDIWSLGAAVWEMASGRHCFSGTNIPQTIIKIFTTRALEHNPHVAAEIQTFIDLCARSNPQERPTAAQLLTDPFLQTP